MKTHRQKQGEMFAFGATFIEGWFPIVGFFTVAALGGLHALIYSLLIATSIATLWAWKAGRLKQFKKPNALKPLVISSLLLGVEFAFLFIGLEFTSVNNVAMILFLQLLFSYLYFQRTESEHLHKLHLIGAILMGTGAILILFPTSMTLNYGDLIVLIAAAIAPIANFYQKRARAFVSTEVVLVSRGVFAVPALWLLAFWIEPTPSWQAIVDVAIWLLFSGVLVFVLAKIFWIEAIYRISITKVNAIYAVSPLLTMLFAYLFLDVMPTYIQVLAVLPIVLGGYLITRPIRSIK